MKCFYCGYLKTIVLDSRGKENFSKVMRRRYCPKCKKRTTTFEIIDDIENKEEGAASILSLINLYKSLVKQMTVLEKSIKLLHPDKFIRSDRENR
jgi:transcriptional regulator NrdR family protein